MPKSWGLGWLLTKSHEEKKKEETEVRGQKSYLYPERLPLGLAESRKFWSPIIGGLRLAVRGATN